MSPFLCPQVTGIYRFITAFVLYLTILSGVAFGRQGLQPPQGVINADYQRLRFLTIPLMARKLS